MQRNFLAGSSNHCNHLKFKINKKSLAIAILVATKSVYAADDCSFFSLEPAVSCVQNDRQLNFNINADINNLSNSPAFSYTDVMSGQTDKTVINLTSDRTITSDSTGIEALVTFGSNNHEIEVTTSGNLITGKASDIDGNDPQTPLNGPSGGIILNETNIRPCIIPSVQREPASSFCHAARMPYPALG